MAAAYRSIASTGWVSDGTGDTESVVTKPSSLAVGDFMLGIHGTANTSTADVSLPSGWTSLFDTTPESGTRFFIFYKIANSSDVAASNFSFPHTNVGTPQVMDGIIVAFSGTGGDFESDTGTSALANAVYSGGVTPTQASTVMIFVAFCGSSVTAGTYELATSNPTWTERLEQGTAGGNAGTVVLATSVRTQSTATGDFDLQWSGVVNSSGLLISLGAAVTVTVTPDPIDLTGTLLAPEIRFGTKFEETVHSLSLTLLAPTIAINSVTTWNAESVSASTWTPETPS